MFVRMSNIYKHGIRLVEALDSIVDFQQGDPKPDLSTLFFFEQTFLAVVLFNSSLFSVVGRPEMLLFSSIPLFQASRISLAL